MNQKITSTDHEVLYPEIKLHFDLQGEGGNAFVVLYKAQEFISQHHGSAASATYFKEATSGDYDHLIRTTARWVSFTDTSGMYRSTGEKNPDYVEAEEDVTEDEEDDWAFDDYETTFEDDDEDEIIEHFGRLYEADLDEEGED